MSFKVENSLEKRKAEAERIRIKYPDRIPVIVERAAGSTIADIDKTKFLVPGDLSVGQLCYVIRKRIKLEPQQAIFVFVGGKLPPTARLLSTLWNENADEDGFLYGASEALRSAMRLTPEAVRYSGENSFG